MNPRSSFFARDSLLAARRPCAERAPSSVLCSDLTRDTRRACCFPPPTSVGEVSRSTCWTSMTRQSTPSSPASASQGGIVVGGVVVEVEVTGGAVEEGGVVTSVVAVARVVVGGVGAGVVVSGRGG